MGVSAGYIEMLTLEVATQTCVDLQAILSSHQISGKNYGRVKFGDVFQSADAVQSTGNHPSREASLRW